MYISSRWGGGGDMSPRSKVRTFDLLLSTVCTEFFMHRVRYEQKVGGHGTPRVHWAVRSHCDVTPSRGDTW